MKTPKVQVRSIKIGTRSLAAPVLPNLPGMNGPESTVARALDDLKIRYIPQQNFLGGSILGGARSDFTLPDYHIVLLYNGPFHDTLEGRGRDLLVNQSYIAQGYKPVPIIDKDLPRIKPRLLEIIGRPI